MRGYLIWCLLLLALAACSRTPSGSEQAAPEPGDPARGKELFNNTQRIAGAPTCQTCHVVEEGEPEVVGPNLSGVALVADERVPGLSAEAYLRQSITDPYAYMLQGYQSSVMVRNYEELLTPQQINDLVAYLMTLR